MRFSAYGRPEPLDKTRKFLESKFKNAGNVNLDYVVALRSTGEFIGLCGSHQRKGDLGWPAIGYQFVKESWGRGYATEAVGALMDAYWALPREECEVSVDKSTVREMEGDGSGDGLVQECVIALTEEDNAGSKNVLRKCGFELEKKWVEPDLRDPTVDIELLGYVARRK
ncbi:hypothetical protein PT974_10090 [Cladobotryum mycophilum]|uniref:N-acetyltransferase domain-containing protein n=1 Tax=Cladobotryum mycophilum TaxID=491253 RepID=A0ABR0S8W4_9HYPO